jgi:hypothetical protein
MTDFNEEQPLQEKSEALRAFKNNLADIMAFMKQLQPPEKLHQHLKDAGKHVKDVSKHVKGLSKHLEDVIASKDDKADFDFRPVQSAIQNAAKTIEEYVAFRKPAIRMMYVMLVSFLEAYFEDALIDLARKNPGLVREPRIDTIRLMEVGSIEELRLEVLQNWSRSKVKSGPKHWVNQLVSMGARSIDCQVVEEAQDLWDIRNLIVHNRSIVSHAYARSRPTLKAGTEITLNPDFLYKKLSAVSLLVDAVEAFLRSYRPEPG